MGGKALVGSLCLIAGFVVGYGAGRVSTGTPINPLSDVKGGGYEKGYEDAMRKVVASGVLPPGVESSMSIEGAITSIGNGQVTLNADLSSLDPLDLKKLPTERVVTVTAATVIVKLEQRGTEEMAEAQRAFEQEAAKFDPTELGALPPSPPTPVKEVSIALSDLKAGDVVTVSAADDILRAESFEAVRIVLPPPSESPLAPPIPSPPDSPPPAEAP